MSWKDKLSESQKTAGSARPDFLKHVTMRLEMKDDKSSGKGNTAFSYWDRDKEEKVFINKPLTGVLIGSAMKLSSFDKNIGRNGGTITSSIFYKLADNAIAFASGEIEFKGTAGSIKEEILNQAGTCKTLRVYYILNENGLYEISTSISFSILEVGGIEPSLFSSNLAVLTPNIYNPSDSKFDARFKKILGKLAETNKPRYASISIGETITDEYAEKIGLEPIIDKYTEFREYTSGQTSVDGIIEGAEKSEATYQDIEQGAFDGTPPMSMNDAPPPEDDDMPF